MFCCLAVTSPSPQVTESLSHSLSWTSYRSQLYLSPASIPFSPFGYFLVIGGSFTMSLGFFGCFGALKEAKCMLGMYFFFLTILLALEIIATVMGFTQKTMIQTKVEEHVLELIKSYGQNQSELQDFERIINHVQKEVHCCGWNQPADWMGAKMPCSCYFSSSSIVGNSSLWADISFSCNGSIPENCDHLGLNDTTCEKFSVGCKRHFEGWIKDNMMVVLGVLLAVIFTELTGMILSMYLYKSIVFDYCSVLRLSGFRAHLEKDTS
ncbi:leukocyte antigen CD37-like isoform X2 [Scleropages formosus]|uniref:leukocyte antigen CD37-like isoform X2 n=1 Tax=Scleropages formosus TaxID=113540 RepID=UPI0008785966|nr:leukocyte antigen CD37-like isoform X2 [Scleropages formosus]